jgi:electron transport complex protein RnfB
MGMFIEIRIESSKCQKAAGCDVCLRICPADVFSPKGEHVVTIFDNEDECAFCGLCVDQCPGQCIDLIKLY